MAISVRYGSLPFQEMIKFFLDKVNVPTQQWTNLQDEGHNVGFMVAGAQQAELLNDLRGAVQNAIENGTTLEEFRKEFNAIVKKRGWIGWTGEGSKEGEAWRTKVIFETNVRQAHHAGREQQMADPVLRRRRPYGQYIHGHSASPRKEHQAWHNKVLPLDDPWWDTHTPMNGWGCKCRKMMLSERDLKRYGLQITRGDDMPFSDVGVDEGFQYRPGENVEPRLRQQLLEKAQSYSPQLQKDTSTYYKNNLKNKE